MKAKITNFARKGLVKDVSWMLIAKLFNVVVQAAYFIIIARILGPEDYGSFIGITALASIIFPFVALGTENVLVQKVAVNQSLFRNYWGICLLTLVVNGSCLLIIALLVSPQFFAEHIAISTIGLILISDLLCLAVIDFSYKALISVYLVNKMAQLTIFSTCGKLLAALCLATFFEKPSTEIWAVLYLFSSVIISIICIILVNRLVGSPRPKLSNLKSVLKEGIYFSIGTSALNINSNLDKTMLAKMATLQATGIYGSAYRFIDVGNVPILALFGATYARFFQKGASGIQDSFKFAKRLLPYVVAYGIVCVIGYHIFAPWIPRILGAEYEEAIAVLLWLSPLPAMFSFQLLAADSLTGAGHQKARSIVQVGAAILNVGLNVWLIPLYSWKGAVWATLVADSFKLIFLWLILLMLARKARIKDRVPNF